MQESDVTINAQIIHTRWPKELKLKKKKILNRPQENWVITKHLSTINTQVPYIK